MESVKLTPEEIGKLVEKLLDLGLRTKFEVATDSTLHIALGKEKLKLSPALQTRAFDLASEAISDRLAVLFAEELLQQIRKVAEEDIKKNSRNPTKRDRKGGSGNNINGNGGTDGRSGNAAPTPENPPRTAQEVYTDLKEFLGKNKSPYAFKDEVLEEMAERVAERGEEIRKMFDLSEKQLLGLAAVSLFDIIFICDDSGSMGIGDRIPALVKTLQSVADWATRLEPSGISLRFLNYDEDGDERFDNVTDLEKIKDLCHLAQPSGDTELGSVLQRKVVNRRIIENQSERSSKPLIVAIITDGEPDDEDESSFCNALMQCKKELEEGSVVFILFRVGNSEDAEEFLEEVSNNEETSDIVYCSRGSGSLDDVVDRLCKAKEGTVDLNPYKRFVLDEFIRSINEGWDSEAYS